MYAKKAVSHLISDSSSTQFNLTANGAMLDIFCCEPSKHVIAQYRRGPAEFALYQSQGVVYFLSRFGDNEWMDAPFHAAMNPPRLSGVPSDFVAGRDHLLLTVRLRDVTSDASYGARMVTLSKEMSATLVEMARGQLAAPISRKDYDARIDRAYSKFTEVQMARMAMVRCKGGVSEPAANAPSMSDEKSEGNDPRGEAVPYFTHITLLTGHEVFQSSESAGPEAREVIRRLIEGSQTNGWTELVLNEKRYPVHLSMEGSNLKCRLCLPCATAEIPRTVVLIGIALDADKGKDFWRAVHDEVGGLAMTSAKHPPSLPWIAAMPMVERLLSDAAALGQLEEIFEMLRWAGDFEVCLAVGFADWMASKLRGE